MEKKMRVVQCWDDGVSADIQLIEVLRKYDAKATFNLNAAAFKDERSEGWEYRGTKVRRLGWNELKDVYDGFKIANHSLTHPHLEQMPIEDARKDVVDGRKRLQDFFGASILGFAYPYGTYNEAVMDVLRDAGHVYGRTTKNVSLAFPPEDPMAFHPTCKFDDPDFWSHYEKARECGVFYFWGHSYELINEAMWNDYENIIKRIAADPEAQWADVEELFI